MGIFFFYVCLLCVYYMPVILCRTAEAEISTALLWEAKSIYAEVGLGWALLSLWLLSVHRSFAVPLAGLLLLYDLPAGRISKCWCSALYLCHPSTMEPHSDSFYTLEAPPVHCCCLLLVPGLPWWWDYSCCSGPASVLGRPWVLRHWRKREWELFSLSPSLLSEAKLLCLWLV
jgi:hypothetical protein